MCEMGDCTCRYHMRYTRWFEVGGEYRDLLSALWVGRVALQKDILDNQLEEEELSEGERSD